MAVSLLERLAGAAPVPAFPLLGVGGRSKAHALRLDPRVHLVRSPRHAAILLALGQLPAGAADAARVVHDQVPAPRAVIAWGELARPSATARPDPVFPGAERVAGLEPTVERAQRALRDLLHDGEGAPSASPAFGPAANPVPWRGLGDHGQGGEGMMGGVPYGRPMAMTAPDLRDGLALDEVHLTIGPFIPWLPAGVCLDVTLQGDLVQSLRLIVLDLIGSDAPAPFLAARSEPVPLAALERARAASHLGSVAELLLLHGLVGRAHRALRLAADASLATTPAHDRACAAKVRRFARSLARGGALRATFRNVGRIAGRDARGLGLATRAAGHREDRRCEDPAYTALDFEPLVAERGDSEARLRLRLDEAAASLVLAASASTSASSLRDPGPALEWPRPRLRGPSGERWRETVASAAEGLAWDELATTLVSLDLDASPLPDAAP